MNELPTNHPEITPTLRLLAEVGNTKIFEIVELDPAADFPTPTPVQPAISPNFIAVTQSVQAKPARTVHQFFDELDQAA